MQANKICIYYNIILTRFILTKRIIFIELYKTYLDSGLKSLCTHICIFTYTYNIITISYTDLYLTLCIFQYCKENNYDKMQSFQSHSYYFHKSYIRNYNL